MVDILLLGLGGGELGIPRYVGIGHVTRKYSADAHKHHYCAFYFCLLARISDAADKYYYRKRQE